MNRGTAAIVLALLAIVGTGGVQWFVTSPGVTTDLEFRALLLLSAPCLVVIVSAYWVDAGRRNREDRR